jgi:uncharacterized membrane protein
MSTYITLYLLSLPVIILGDALWLGLIAKDFYWSRLGHLLGDVVWQPAVVFYLLFVAGITYFVSYPLVDASLSKVALNGAFFGFIAYATYDLTNHATMRDWPLSVTLTDMVWGAFLGAVVTAFGVGIYRAFFA